MRSIKTFTILIILFIFSSTTEAQVAEDSKLFKTLKQNDSLLFNEGFNKCNISQFEKLIAEDFEFYHDKSGITDSREAFLNSIKNGLCGENNPTKSRRILIKNSLKVYALYNDNKLYGAIQEGEHSFTEQLEGKPVKKTSKAKFTHLWIINGERWQIKRVLSYNHIMQ